MMGPGFAAKAAGIGCGAAVATIALYLVVWGAMLSLAVWVIVHVLRALGVLH